MSVKKQDTEKALTSTELKSKKEALASQLRYQRDKDREIVKGIFRFHEVPGGCLPFIIKVYKDDPIERFDLIDGQIYSIPLGVAKHLNKNGWYPVHAYTQDENGKTSMKIGQKIRRFSFQSLEFVDLEDLTPVGGPLVTVEHI